MHMMICRFGKLYSLVGTAIDRTLSHVHRNAVCSGYRFVHLLYVYSKMLLERSNENVFNGIIPRFVHYF